MLIKRKQKQLRRAKSLTLNISLSYEPVREMCLQPPQISFPLILFRLWLFAFSFIRSSALVLCFACLGRGWCYHRHPSLLAAET